MNFIQSNIYLQDETITCDQTTDENKGRVNEIKSKETYIQQFPDIFNDKK